MRTQTMTQAQVDEAGRCHRLRPTEKDILASKELRKGHWRKHRTDGTYEWGCDYKTNEGGVLTKAANEFLAMMRPFSKADAERHAKNQAGMPRVALRNRSGGVDFMSPDVADATADQTGRSHLWRAKGSPTERGAGGMLFKWDGLAWWPTGRWCSGTPCTQTFRPKWGRKDGAMMGRGIQHDPDGCPWVWADGEWRA